jgi:hypothetical protein
MKAFDPGWVPHGFTPGEPLRMVKARGPGYITGIIEQDCHDLLRDSACITVPERDFHRATAWLAAWNAA